MKFEPYGYQLYRDYSPNSAMFICFVPSMRSLFATP
jgi:hypothetical protein